MARSLPLTLLVEGLLVVLYALWRRKPALTLLLASVIMNLFTQVMLWAAINLYIASPRLTVSVAEIFIFVMEGAFLRLFPGSRLGWVEAMLLSLAINLASFSAGWLLKM